MPNRTEKLSPLCSCKHKPAITPIPMRISKLLPFVAVILFGMGVVQKANAASVHIQGPTEVQSGQTFFLYSLDERGNRINCWWACARISPGEVTQLYENHDRAVSGFDWTWYVLVDTTLQFGAFDPWSLEYDVVSVLIHAPRAVSLRIDGPSEIQPNAVGVYKNHITFHDGREWNLAEGTKWFLRDEGGILHPWGENTAGCRLGGGEPHFEDANLTLIAEYTDQYGNIVRGEKSIVFKAWPVDYISIVGPAALTSSGEADFTATGNGTQQSVQALWRIVEGAAYGEIDESGHFKAYSTKEERRIVIQAEFNGRKSTFTITVAPKKAVVIAINGPTTLKPGEAGTYSCKAQFDDGSVEVSEAIWSISSGNEIGPAPAISWIAPFVYADTTYVVKAIRDNLSASLSVTVPSQAPDYLEIVGPHEVDSFAKNVQYRCFAVYANGEKREIEVKWSFMKGGQYVLDARASGNGCSMDFVSTINQLVNAIDIRVSTTVNNRIVYGSLTVTVRHKTETGLVLHGPGSIVSGNTDFISATVFYDDGTEGEADPQDWTISPELDRVHAGWIDTVWTESGRVDSIQAVYHGNWADVEGSTSVRIIGHGTDDPDISGMSIVALYVRPETYPLTAKIGTPGRMKFYAIGRFTDGRNNFDRDVTGLCEWLFLSRYDYNYASLEGSTVIAQNYTTSSKQICIKAVYHGTQDTQKSALGWCHIDPAARPIPDPIHEDEIPEHPEDDEEATLSGITITGPDVLPSKGRGAFVCRALFSDGTTLYVIPTWSVESGRGDMIDASGTLTVASSAALRNVSVTAVFRGKTAMKTVAVYGRNLSSISVSGPTSVNSGDKAVYKCSAKYDDGTENTVWPEWSIESGTDFGSISSSGVFEAASTDTRRMVRVKAVFEGKKSTKTVSVIPENGPGTIVPSIVSAPIYRFYSKKYRGHFFTLDENEKNELINNNPNWKFEGIAYYAFRSRGEGMSVLYRFYSKSYNAHFFTIDENEKNSLIATNPNWKYEGEAYYVYSEPAEGTVPVFRFWSKSYRHHFFTTSEEERDGLIAGNPNWKYEGIAFYAQSGEATAPDERPVTGISISGPESVLSGATAVFTCDAILDDGGSIEIAPVWSISEGGGFASIDQSGLLETRETDASRSVRVRASWNGHSATFDVEVEALEHRTVELSIEGATTVSCGETMTLSCKARLDNGTEMSVFPEWSVISGAEFGSISQDGAFEALNSGSGTVEIQAEWNGMTAAWIVSVTDGTEGWDNLLDSGFRGEPSTVSAKTLSSATMDLNVTCPVTEKSSGMQMKVPGLTWVDGVVLEARTDSPEAKEFWVDPCRDDLQRREVPLRLALPEGEWNVSVWSAADGELGTDIAEDSFDFALPATGVWHWLRIRDAEGDCEDAFSVWLRAE